MTNTTDHASTGAALLLDNSWLHLSEERKALLAPKLRALLADFEKLAALDCADLQPVSTDWLVRRASSDRR
jgi:Asp-tRNA(Asn)/Glu-tRNA(Gln) amidotransferase C subunit